jgi:chorismate lyase / 3-hydroxybenzoate synthase
LQATDFGPDTQSATLRVAYQPLSGQTSHGIDLWPAGLLAAVRFGAVTPLVSSPAVPLVIDVGLAPLQGPPTAELWFASGPVRTGRWSHDSDSGRAAADVRYAHDEHHLFAVIELDERQHGGILPTAERAYAAMREFQQQSAFGHLLRMWNYMDDINQGHGDTERYRQFCVGRGLGLGNVTQGYPSATAIGRQRGDHLLQVFWLAGKQAGKAVENPRQVSAYHYPRVHGPVSPTFARALVAPDETVLISGTASIVGHVSQHHDDVMEQLEETVRNLKALNAHSGRRRMTDEKELLKVYIRDASLTAPIAERIRQLYPDSEVLFVAADICRRELLLEIEAVIGA